MMQPQRSVLPDDRSLVESLVETGRYLHADGYRFTAVTPATHARVLERDLQARDHVDIFGWNRPFDRHLLDGDIFDALSSASLLRRHGSQWVSAVGFANLGGALYAHSAHPANERDAVLFGPDTHRFVNAVRRSVSSRCGLLVDVGCGSGAGGLELRGKADRVVLGDINDRALAFAQANARLAGATKVDLRRSDVLDHVTERPDVIIASPPCLADPLRRAGRDGGGELGMGLSLRIVEQSLDRLRPGGRLLLHTASPVVDGVDRLLAEVAPMAADAGADLTYEELDPDVFGDELERPDYAEVDRIARVLLSLTTHGPHHTHRFTE